MARFELDRLFGLALTDSRFFRQLRECPAVAVAQFELTESEEQAVLSIAPTADSIQQLALQLDLWMTGDVTKQIPNLDPVRQRGTIASHRYTPSHDAAPVNIKDDKSEICLTLSELALRS
jgi:hypothetical protein